MCCGNDAKGAKDTKNTKNTKKIASHVLTRPACMALWWASWHFLCALCRYGNFGKNGVMLLVCLFLFACVLVWGIRLRAGYGKQGCAAVQPVQEGGTLYLEEEAGEEQEEKTQKRELCGESVRWYVKEGDFLRLFLKTKEVLLLDLRGLKTEERDFLELKLSAVNPTGRTGYRRFAGIFLLAVMLWGSISAAESAVPYNGKLAWYLKDLQDKRTVLFVHDNVYETGVDGILEDIRRKVDLPQTLCLATSFNLHFSYDGTVQTLDTMLYGFDEEGEFAGSYLVSYNAARSRKMSIYLHGTPDAEFQADKDLQPLVEAVRVMPLEQNAALLSRWDDSYGILYYGVRDWPGGEGVRFINYYGECWDPPFWERDFKGYSISLFCPDADNVPPLRYLYMGYRTPPGSGILP